MLQKAAISLRPTVGSFLCSSLAPGMWMRTSSVTSLLPLLRYGQTSLNERLDLQTLEWEPTANYNTELFPELWLPVTMTPGGFEGSLRSVPDNIVRISINSRVRCTSPSGWRSELGGSKPKASTLSRRRERRLRHVHHPVSRKARLRLA